MFFSIPGLENVEIDTRMKPRLQAEKPTGISMPRNKFVSQEILSRHCFVPIGENQFWMDWFVLSSFRKECQRKWLRVFQVRKLNFKEFKWCITGCPQHRVDNWLSAINDRVFSDDRQPMLSVCIKSEKKLTRYYATPQENPENVCSVW